jgi:hypothetical protein
VRPDCVDRDLAQAERDRRGRRLAALLGQLREPGQVHERDRRRSSRPRRVEPVPFEHLLGLALAVRVDRTGQVLAGERGGL